MAPTPAAPMLAAWRTEPNSTSSALLGYVSSSLWLIFTMKGMRCAKRRDTLDNTPKVEATAEHPPSMASSTIDRGSNMVMFLAKLAAPECSMP